MWRSGILGLIWSFSSLWAIAQCVALKERTPSMDRDYIDAVRHEQLLILASRYGLFFKDLDSENLDTIHVEPVPGEVIQLILENGRLFAVAEGQGIFVYRLQENRLPDFETYYEVPGIKKAVVKRDKLFAYASGVITLFKPLGFGELELLGTQTVVNETFAVNHQFLFTANESGRLSFTPYSSTGFAAKSQFFSSAETAFSFDVFDELLVMETSSGMKWFELEADGSVARQGLFSPEASQERPLASFLSAGFLFLKYEDHLAVFRIDSNRQSKKIGMLPLTFLESVLTQISVSESGFDLLATHKRNPWRLRSYRFSEGGFELQHELLEAPFSLHAIAELGEVLYAGSTHRVSLIQSPLDFDHLADLSTAWSFKGRVGAMVASDSLLLVTEVSDALSTTTVWVFEGREDGTLKEVLKRKFSGSVSQISENRDQFAFTVFQRTTREDNYTNQVLYRNGDGQFQLKSFSRTVSHTSENPLRDFQMSPWGLLYHNGFQLSVFPELGHWSEPVQIDLPRIAGSPKLLAVQERVWLETDQGIRVYKLEHQKLTLLGNYPFWFGMRRLSARTLLASNQLDGNPASRHLLRIDERGLVTSALGFNATANPEFVSIFGEELLVSEVGTLNVFRLHCPEPERFYLLPFRPGLELELATNIQESDVITMTTYNAQNQIIGSQHLNADRIAALNGGTAEDWVVEYNRLETPDFVLLGANRDLIPVISGYAGKNGSARFAFRLLEWSGSEVFVPHVPRDLASWRTELFVESFDGSGRSHVQLQNAAGETVINQGFSSGAQDFVRLEDASFSAPTTWASLSSLNLNAVLSGFSLFQHEDLEQAAAVPFVSELSEFLTVPFLAGRSEHAAWTGMVLTNPENRSVAIRILGYGTEKSIILDETFTVPPLQSTVALVEDWLCLFDSGNEVHWFSLVSSHPVMGMLLYGNREHREIAGLPLGGDSGELLAFSGIRTHEKWWTELVITNLDAHSQVLEIEAFGETGRVLAALKEPLEARGCLKAKVTALFSHLSHQELKRLATIRIRGTGSLMGIAFRGSSEGHSLEAYRGLTQ